MASALFTPLFITQAEWIELLTYPLPTNPDFCTVSVIVDGNRNKKQKCILPVSTFLRFASSDQQTKLLQKKITDSAGFKKQLNSLLQTAKDDQLIAKIKARLQQLDEIVALYKKQIGTTSETEAGEEKQSFTKQGTTTDKQCSNDTKKIVSNETQDHEIFSQRTYSEKLIEIIEQLAKLEGALPDLSFREIRVKLDKKELVRSIPELTKTEAPPTLTSPQWNKRYENILGLVKRIIKYSLQLRVKIGALCRLTWILTKYEETLLQERESFKDKNKSLYEINTEIGNRIFNFFKQYKDLALLKEIFTKIKPFTKSPNSVFFVSSDTPEKFDNELRVIQLPGGTSHRVSLPRLTLSSIGNIECSGTVLDEYRRNSSDKSVEEFFDFFRNWPKVEASYKDCCSENPTAQEILIGQALKAFSRYVGILYKHSIDIYDRQNKTTEKKE